jgi:hypothetical protein
VAGARVILIVFILIGLNTRETVAGKQLVSEDRKIRLLKDGPFWHVQHFVLLISGQKENSHDKS